jgi:poly(3-hydroxybutyrate) depolymerase
MLLVDTVSAERSAEFLAEPTALARAVTAEVAALEKGRNPYARREGDLWRSYRGTNGSTVPVRVIAPPGAASKSMGVLIALHGAGGDENMFAMAYGQGVAARLARENNLLFVSPATTPFMSSAVQFDSLMAVLGRDYRIDPARVYLMGHSMGAGAAARLVQERPQAIAAVACLAGGSAVTAAGAPPMLFIGAALDPIIPAARVKAAAAGTPDKVTLNFYLPHSIEFQGQKARAPVSSASRQPAAADAPPPRRARAGGPGVHPRRHRRVRRAAGPRADGGAAQAGGAGSALGG